MESSMTIKAIQIKTQADLNLLNLVKEMIKDSVALDQGGKINFYENFTRNCLQHAHFENHFQELAVKVKKFDEKIEIVKKNQDFSAGLMRTKIKIPEKNNEKFSECLSLPSRAKVTGKYLIETRNGRKVIPAHIAAQIDRAREKGEHFVNINNGERITNYVDLVNWKSYKITAENEQETYYYRIFPQN
jgi:hypothetical protein